MAGDAIRAQSAQSRGLRWAEIRGTNYEDPIAERDAAIPDDVLRPRVLVVNSAYAAADTVAEGSAVWGPAIRVVGYDRLTMMLKHTEGTATTAVHVGVQVSYQENTIATDPEWFDLFEDETNDGAVVRKVFDWTTSAAGRIAWNLRTHGVFMRFKVWTTGANRANSRATLYARRIMDAL